jgi:phospholipid/cholesterol/gamma-HCH transport system permease protein
MIGRAMPKRAIETVGQRAIRAVEAFGDFCLFNVKAFRWIVQGGVQAKTIRLMLPQMFDVGVRSIPVIAITGAFIGMVMAVEMFPQFKSIGQEQRLGAIICLSVVKQIGPVLAALMLAGRIGGALTAELGTMNVTEQIDALRVMGTDPIRHLVVPRFLACIVLTPILTIFSDIMGIAGGSLVTVQMFDVPAGPYWHYVTVGVGRWAVLEGLGKSVFFGGAIGMISCYKGFTCGAGASGVGRACTEAFVYSFLAIIVFNFFFAQFMKDLYTSLFGVTSVFGG